MPAYRNVNDRDGADLARGLRAEELFRRLFCRRFGEGRIRGARDLREDYGHTDFVITGKSGRERRVDVKSAKTVDGRPACWLEFVCHGILGWLYGSHDFVAFERPAMDGFVVVAVAKLREYASRMLRLDVTDRTAEAWGRLYVRRKGAGSCDIVGLVPFEDVARLADWEL